jgi:WD40 repeat protein
MSRSSHTFYVATGDGHVVVWDPDSGARRDVAAHQGVVTAVRTIPGSDAIATAGADGLLTLRDRDAGLLRSVAVGGQLITIAVSPQLLAVGDAGGRVHTWDLRSGALRRIGEVGSAISMMELDPDGAHLVAVSTDGQQHIWDLAGGTVVHAAGGALLAMGSDGRWIGTGSTTGTIAMTDLATGWRRELHAHRSAIGFLAASVRGDLASVAGDGELRLWGPALRPAHLLAAGEGELRDLVFLDGGTTIVTVSRTGTVWRWSLADGNARVVARHRGCVELLPLPGRDALASVGRDDGVIQLIGAHGDGRRIAALGDGHFFAAALPDGRGLVVGGASGAVISIDLDAGAQRELLRFAHPVADVEAVSGTARVGTARVVAASERGELAEITEGISDATSAAGLPPLEVRRDLAGLTPGDALLTAIPFGRDAVVTGTNAGVVAWWSAGAPLAVRPTAHRVQVFGFTAARDGRLLASRGADGALAIWRGDGAPLGRLSFDGPVLGAQFDPSSAVIAGVGGGDAVQIAAVDGSARLALPAPGLAYRVRWSPRGDAIAVSGTTDRVEIWNVDLARLVPRDPVRLAVWLQRAAGELFSEPRKEDRK